VVEMEKIIECPFCHRNTIKAFYKPSFLQAKTSRISAGAKTQYYRVPETYEIRSGCPSCGKRLEEVREAYEGRKRLSHEERLKLWKKRGLPLVLGSK